MQVNQKCPDSASIFGAWGNTAYDLMFLERYLAKHIESAFNISAIRRNCKSAFAEDNRLVAPSEDREVLVSLDRF